MQADLDELHDLSGEQAYAGILDELTAGLIDHLYGPDLAPAIHE